MRYIVLLRGINVGGKKRVKMIDLKNLFGALDLKHVKTYLQSGNAIFDYDTTDEILLANEIEKKIYESFGFEVKVVLRTTDELANIVRKNPFVNEPKVELDQLHVTFMRDIIEPKEATCINVIKEENERFIISSKEVYLYCPNGYGRTKLNNSFFEKKLKTVATTRNWRTINSLVEISEQDINK